MMLLPFSSLFLAALPLISAQTLHNVTVGLNGGLTFTPETITAEVGDFVQLFFVSKNHTTTQSSFDSPCSPLIGSDGVTPTGFDSGFKPVPPGGTPVILGFQVFSTDPRWFYCKQTGHCQKGMVFAVNPPATGNTFDQFKARAIGTTPPTTTSTATLASSTSPTMPSGTPVIHQITVGGNSSLTFDPSNIAAQPNDIVQFTFVSKNHTITQSTFANPCVAGLKDGSPGFNSGFMPIAANSSNFPTFNVTVNNTSPIWGFCAQTGHCGKGMVFAINAPENGTNTFDAFRAAAINGTTTTTSSEPSKPTTISTSSSSSPRPSGGASSRYNIVGGGAGFVAMVFGAFLL